MNNSLVLSACRNRQRGVSRFRRMPRSDRENPAQSKAAMNRLPLLGHQMPKKEQNRPIGEKRRRKWTRRNDVSFIEGHMAALLPQTA
jgi:hypothetical protein